MLDLACGKGELLCRWAEWFGSGGVGVDLSPVFLGAAVARSDELGVADRVTFDPGDAGTYVPERARSTSRLASGRRGSAAASRARSRCCDRRWRRGGTILIGEPYWVEPPPDEAVEALEFGADEFASLDGTLDRLEAAGVELVEMVLADGDSWDRYEAAQWRTIVDWLDANPADPDHDAMRAVPRAGRRTTCAGAAATSAGALRHPPALTLSAAPPAGSAAFAAPHVVRGGARRAPSRFRVARVGCVHGVHDGIVGPDARRRCACREPQARPRSQRHGSMTAVHAPA